MNYKKHLVGLLLTIGFIASAFCVNVHALPKKDFWYDSVPNYNGIMADYGKLHYVSSNMKVKQYVSYHSYWNKFQSDDIISLNDYQLDLYSTPMYVDIPMEIYSSDRLNPNQSLSEEGEMTYNYTNVYENSSKHATTIVNEYTNKFSIEAEVEFESVGSASAKSDNEFKYNEQYVDEYFESCQKSKSSSLKFTKKFDYTNDNQFPVFAKKTIRQRYQVFLFIKFKYFYVQTRTGSGLFGKDDNYTYKLDHIYCSDVFSILVPIDKPYFEISIYKDNGSIEYLNTYNSNVLFF